MWSRTVHLEWGELLGEGSQGRVFKALRRDRSTGLTQTIAVKILHSKNAVEIWKREFESLSRVRSPYCLQVLGFERLRHRPALILEYVEGVPLMDLARSQLLDGDDIDEISAQIAMGLRDLSQQQVFHGDLSPHNVLVDQEGHIRLLDFGLANYGGSEVRLTPAFAASQRLAGQPASFETDLISLAKLVAFLKGQDVSCFQNHQPPADSHPERCRLLGMKVRTRLEIQKTYRDLRTKTVTERKKRKSSIQLMGLLVFLMVTASSGADRMVFRKPSMLRVRTRMWHHLSLDGREIGYAPAEIPILDNKFHHLRWHSPEKEGSLEFRLEPGELRLITDRDLTH